MKNLQRVIQISWIYSGQADDILGNQMDTIMEVFRESDTQFYNEYKNARVIRDL
jgi:hypothetical protein